MKRILLAVAILAALPALALSQTARGGANQGGGKDEQAVLKFLTQIAAAVERNDVAALERIYADDLTFVGPFGTLQNKEQRLAEVRSGDWKYESVGFDEAAVRIYGNTAVATSLVMLKGQFKGRDVAGRFRTTLTLVKTKGRWRLVAGQNTPVAGQ